MASDSIDEPEKAHGKGRKEEDDAKSRKKRGHKMRHDSRSSRSNKEVISKSKSSSKKQESSKDELTRKASRKSSRSKVARKSSSDRVKSESSSKSTPEREERRSRRTTRKRSRHAEEDANRKSSSQSLAEVESAVVPSDAPTDDTDSSIGSSSARTSSMDAGVASASDGDSKVLSMLQASNLLPDELSVKNVKTVKLGSIASPRPSFSDVLSPRSAVEQLQPPRSTTDEDGDEKVKQTAESANDVDAVKGKEGKESRKDKEDVVSDAAEKQADSEEDDDVRDAKEADNAAMKPEIDTPAKDQSADDGSSSDEPIVASEAVAAAGKGEMEAAEEKAEGKDTGHPKLAERDATDLAQEDLAVTDTESGASKQEEPARAPNTAEQQLLVTETEETLVAKKLAAADAADDLKSASEAHDGEEDDVVRAGSKSLVRQRASAEAGESRGRESSKERGSRTKHRSRSRKRQQGIEKKPSKSRTSKDNADDLRSEKQSRPDRRGSRSPNGKHGSFEPDSHRKHSRSKSEIPESPRDKKRRHPRKNSNQGGGKLVVAASMSTAGMKAQLDSQALMEVVDESDERNTISPSRSMPNLADEAEAGAETAVATDAASAPINREASKAKKKKSGAAKWMSRHTDIFRRKSKLASAQASVPDSSSVDSDGTRGLVVDSTHEPTHVPKRAPSSLFNEPMSVEPVFPGATPHKEGAFARMESKPGLGTPSKQSLQQLRRNTRLPGSPVSASSRSRNVVTVGECDKDSPDQLTEEDMQKVQAAVYPSYLSFDCKEYEMKDDSFLEEVPDVYKEMDLTGLGLERVENICHLRKLKRLYLAQNKITSVNLTSLRALLLLSLFNNKLTSVPKMDGASSLIQLDLRGNQLTDGFEELAKPQSLQVLDLSRCRLNMSIEEFRSKLLAPLKELPQLQYLCIGDNPMVLLHPELRYEVLDALPNLKFYDFEPITPKDREKAGMVVKEGIKAIGGVAEGAAEEEDKPMVQHLAAPPSWWESALVADTTMVLEQILSRLSTPEVRLARLVASQWDVVAKELILSREAETLSKVTVVAPARLNRLADEVVGHVAFRTGLTTKLVSLEQYDAKLLEREQCVLLMISSRTAHDIWEHFYDQLLSMRCTQLSSRRVSPLPFRHLRFDVLEVEDNPLARGLRLTIQDLGGQPLLEEASGKCDSMETHALLLLAALARHYPSAGLAIGGANAEEADEDLPELEQAAPL